MPEEPSTVGGQEPTSSQPQAGTPGAAPQAGSSQSASQFKSLEEAEAAFQRLLKDKQEANSEAAETKRRLKQLEDAAKTEDQKRAEHLAELEAHASTFDQERQQWLVERAVLVAAPQAGINPALAMRLIDLADVKTNAKGEPNNIPELLAKAIADFKLQPGQSAGQPALPNIGASNPSRSATTGVNALSWEVIGRMTPQEYEARRPEIQRWMSDPKNKISRF